MRPEILSQEKIPFTIGFNIDREDTLIFLAVYA